MFGEKLIVGHSEGKITDRGRIFIPSFANPENGDEIVIQAILQNNIQALKVFAYQEYLNIIDRLKRLRDNATTLEEFQKYTKEIEKICFSLEYYTKIDAQKRIIIPKKILDDFRWEVHDAIKFDGLGSSLLINKK